MKHLQPNKRIVQLTSPVILGPLLIVVGIAGLCFSTIIRNPYTILFPSALIIGTLSFYVLSQHQRDITEINIKDWYSKAILALFFLVISALIVQYHIVGFNRTSGIFYLTFFLYLLTGLYILADPHPVFALSVLLTAGLTNRLTAYYNSVLYSGVDIYSHSQDVQAIATSGSLETFTANKYFYAPFYHILAVGGKLIYSVPTRDAIALTILFAVAVIPILVVYILTTYFWNAQIGLIGGLLYVTADHVINWAIHVIPTSLGVVFYSLLLMFIVKFMIFRGKRHYLFIPTYLIVLTFTHQVSLFIGITTTGVLAVAIMLYQLRPSKTAINLSLLAGLVAFVDFIVTKYSGPEGGRSFFEVVLGNLIMSLIGDVGPATRTVVGFPQDPSISPDGAAALTLLQVAGPAILLTLAVVGALYWLSSKCSNGEFLAGIGLSLTVTILLAVTLGGPTIGIPNLLPTRWWAFAYVPLAILAAPGLFVIMQKTTILVRISRKERRFAATVIFVMILFPYIALMGGNWAGAHDQPLLNDAPGAESGQISETERQLFEHAVEYKPENNIEIITDRRSRSVFSRYYDTPVQTLFITYNQPESLHSPSLIINREYIHTQHSQYNIQLEETAFTVHGAFPLEKISNRLKQTTYDSGNHSIVYYTESNEHERKDTAS